QLRFGLEENQVQIRSLREVAQLQARYRYDPEQDALIDQQTEEVYVANEDTGFFENAEGQPIVLGYQVEIGFQNFQRLFRSSAISGPLLRIFLWTFAFAILTVLTTFALGLLVALVFNTKNLAGRKLIRSLLIIPYTIPSVISVLMWRGLMN